MYLKVHFTTCHMFSELLSANYLEVKILINKFTF